MSDKGNIPTTPNTTSTVPTDTTKQTEGPLLLEIKAAVEKLAGDVRGLTERMNKQDKKPEDKKPEDKYPPPCKSCDELAAEAAAKAKKPEEKLPPEKAKQDPATPAPPAAEDHGCGPDEEWDGKACVPKAAKATKPEPYPEEPKKSLELINAQMNEMSALKEEVSSLRKCLGIAPFKRTTVIRKEDLNTPIDVSKMSYAQLNELARPVDMRRMQ